MKTAPTTINEHIFIRRLCLKKSFSSRTVPKDVRAGPFESSKNFNYAQLVQTNVYPNPGVPHEINTTGKPDMTYSATPFHRGSYQRRQPSLFGIPQQNANSISKENEIIRYIRPPGRY